MVAGPVTHFDPEDVVPFDDTTGVRWVVVWAKDPESWALEVDFGDEMSPFEAWGMLRVAAERSWETLLEGDEEEE